MKKGIQRLTAVVTVLAVVLGLFAGSVMDTEAATKITFKKTSYHLYHNKWTSGAKFGSGGGTKAVKSNVVAKLHYVNGTYGYCAYMPDSSTSGAATVYSAGSDSRTTWVTKSVGGYQRYAYCAVAQAYLVNRTVSLSGISNSSSLFSKSATERMLLAQAFVWYMEYAGYNRSSGSYAMAIKGISGWSASAQYVLFDQIYTAAKAVLPYLATSQSMYKMSKKGGSYQPILILSTSGSMPGYASISRSKQEGFMKQTEISVEKTDDTTGAYLSGAEFSFAIDGKKVGTAVTDSDGIAKFTYARKMETSVYSVAKPYVTNWGSLTAAARQIVTRNGYYMDANTAATAAQTEANAKASAALASLKSTPHTWTVTETKAPPGHKIPEIPSKTLTEGTAAAYKVSFSNAGKSIVLSIKKGSVEEDYGVEATFQGAEYGLYAEEPVLKTDNKTVFYKPDEQVETLVTDKDGNASANGLYPGKYYLKELTAPKGFQIDPEKVPVDLSEESSETDVRDHVISGRIRVEKTYGGEILEEGAVFEVRNAKDELAATLVTDASGIAESGELPYGSYSVKQTVGIEGYEFASDAFVTIDGSEETIVIQMDNVKKFTGLEIIKSTLVDDKETGVYEKKAEEGAEFEILLNGKLVENLVTDQYGAARSGDLEPRQTYTIHQTKGMENFEMVEDFEIVPEENQLTKIEAVDRNTPRKVRIKKTMSRDNVPEPEEGAEFVVLDAESVGEVSGLESQEDRQDYVASLPEAAVVATIRTDAEGEGAVLLNNLSPDKEFVVLQVTGAKGHLLADPYYSKDEKPKQEGLAMVYTVEADDILDEWAKFKIKKSMTVSRTESSGNTEPEEGAEFLVADQKGETVCVLTTDENGKAVTGQLDYGIYTIRQTAGSPAHEYIPLQRIELTNDSKHKTLEFPYVNEERQVQLKLLKTSTETGIPVEGAAYGVYNEAGEKAANILTDGNGTASCMLPYGKYQLVEESPADGYKLSEAKAFEISFRAVEYDADGNGVFVLEDQDEPVYGKIGITKTGEILSGFGSGQFQYSQAAVVGAEYGLYARGDVLADDGSVLWKAETLICKGETGVDGALQFLNPKDGTEMFPCGAYFVKETKAPYGYTLDAEEHEVVITWDTGAGDANDMGTDADIPDPDNRPGRPEPTSGSYVLCTGAKLNPLLKGAESVTFMTGSPPTGIAYTDVSADGDKTVLLWNDGKDYFITTKTGTGSREVVFNAVSSGMFEGITTLKNIYFDNVDTSNVIDADRMFKNCTGLSVLDLSNFNTEKFRFVNEMFAGCSNLVTIYAPDTDILEEGKPTLVSVTAEPKHDFLLGIEYQVEDFTFRAQYSDGSEEEFVANGVEIRPGTATPIGKQEVSFVFPSDSKYVSAGMVKAQVNVVDVESGDIKAPEDVDYRLELEDTLKTNLVEFRKTDTGGKPVEGAEFTLYAEADIFDAYGFVLFRKGDAVISSISTIEDSGEAVVTFRGLPTDLYAPDGAGKLYTIKETKAAPGYIKSEDAVSFPGGADRYGNASVLFHTEADGKAGTVETEGGTAYIYDLKTFVNEPQEYVTIHKAWEDGDNAGGIRPDSISVKVTYPGGTKTYILKKEDGWTAVTDIPRDSISGCIFTETPTNGYTGTVEVDAESAVCEITNELDVETVDIPAVKIWDDNNDRDGLRPKAIRLSLYRGNEQVSTETLSALNGWEYIWKDQPYRDSAGNVYEYEVREELFDGWMDDPETGYESEVKEVLPDDTNGYDRKTFVVTNTHNARRGSIAVTKKIRPEDVRWEIWEPEFMFHLTGTTDKGIRYEESKTVTFAKGESEKAVVFENLEPGVYEVTESGLDAYYTLKEITGNVQTGSEKAVVNLGRDDLWDVQAVFSNEARKGTVRVHKTDDSGKPLQGVEFALYDADGKEIARKVTDASGSLVFENLGVGEYTFKETKAAQGMSLLTEPVALSMPLVLTDAEVKELGADAGKAVKSEGSSYFYELTYDVSNTAVLKLPDTGGDTSVFLVLTGLVLTAAGMIRRQKRK